MAFTVSAVAAKDGAGATITGGLIAGDIAGSGTGPFFLYHGLIDGVLGVNKAKVLAASTAAVAGDTALVVALHPSSTTKGGGAADANTMRVTVDTLQLGGLQSTAQAMLANYSLVALPTDQTKIPVHGNTAHGGTDADNPLKMGLKATTSLAGLTLTTDAKVSDMRCGIDGVVITRPHANLEDIVTGVATCTSGANTSGIAAIGAGIKFYLCAVLISNTGGVAAGNLSITDGSGGTEKANIPFSTVGAVENLPVPVGFTANTAVFVDPSGTDTIKVTLIGFKSKV